MGTANSTLDSKDRASLDRFTADLRKIYGDVLQSVALTGEAASESYRPGRTPLETVVVVESVTPAVLRAARGSLRDWARKRISTPLFLDPPYLERALDAFPLEFLEIADNHLVLAGDPDYFDRVRIDSAHLRLEVEEQLRGKLLHLWEHYLASGGKRRSLERLLVETVPGFEMAMRGLLRLRGRGDAGELEAADATTRRPNGVALIEAVAEELSLPLPTIMRLEAIRLEGGRIPDRDLDPLFEDYLGELRAIVGQIDRF